MMLSHLRFRLDHALRRRLAGLNVISERPVQHAHRTEFHCSGKSLPQLGQTRLSSVFMALTALRMQPRRRKESNV